MSTISIGLGFILIPKCQSAGKVKPIYPLRSVTAFIFGKWHMLPIKKPPYQEAKDYYKLKFVAKVVHSAAQFKVSEEPKKGYRRAFNTPGYLMM